MTTGGSRGHLAAGSIVGRYTIIELIGEGGFAEVYSARVTSGSTAAESGQHVALKVIKRGMDSREIVSRFRAEHRTIELLRHRCIVQPLATGLTEGGLPYFAMAQIDGLPVTEYCETAQLPLEGRLKLFLMFCEAMQYAHRKGVLHRDLKPSNILVEETADGPIPKIIDFGIAKAREPVGSGATMVTQLGQVLGTPTYMSPEQAAGSDDADTRSDIYSLGAVLYEMVTGCPPFDHDKLSRLPAHRWSAELRENLPALPSRRLRTAGGSTERVKLLKGSVDDILRKAMATDPNDRYRSAAAFGDDVQHFLEGRPISAHPPSLSDGVKQFVRRHRWPVALALTILAGVIASAAIASVLAVQARRAEAKALTEKSRAIGAEQRASEARDRADHQNYQASIETATMHLENGQPYLAAERLRNTPAELRGWEWGYLMAAVPQPEATADPGLASLGVIAASPDGEIAAVAEGKTLRVIDVRKNGMLAEENYGSSISRVAVSEDKLRVGAIESVSPEENVLHVLRIDTREHWIAPLCASADIAWEPAASGGALLSVCGNGPAPSTGRLVRFDAASGRVLNERVIDRYKVPARSLLIGSAGRMAVVLSSYKDVEVVALPELQTLSVDQQASGEAADDYLLDDIRDLLVVARGSRVYAGPASHSDSGPAGELSTGGDANAAHIRHLNWLPDGRWLAAGETSVLVEGQQPQRLPNSAAGAVIPLTAGRLLAVLKSGRLEIRPELVLSAPAFAVLSAGNNDAEGRGTAFTPDSKRALFQSWRRDALQFVPLDQGTAPYPAAHFAQQPSAEWSVLPMVHPDGSVLVSVDNHLVSVRESGGALGQAVIPETDGVWSADSTADGSRLAVGLATGVRLLDWKTRAVLRDWPLAGGPFRVASLGVGSDGVVAVGRDSVLHYLPLDGAPSSTPMPFRVNGFYPAPLAFDAARRTVAGALADGGYAVYDLGPLPGSPRLVRHAASVPAVTALAFTPDARRLAVGTDDHRLSLWDWAEGLSLLTLPLNSTCASVAFSPDGQWMANADYAPSLVLRYSGPATHSVHFR